MDFINNETINKTESETRKLKVLASLVNKGIHFSTTLQCNLGLIEGV